MYTPFTYRTIPAVTLGQPAQAGAYVHFNNDPIFLYGNYTVPERMCLYHSVETCVPPYPPNDVCDSVSPGCTCYKWTFAGVSDSSVVTVSDYQADPDCVDFIITNTGSVDFYFEMSATYPVLPLGLMVPLLDGYNEWPLRYSNTLSYYAELFMAEHCQPDLFDGVGECALKHTLQIVAGRADWLDVTGPDVAHDLATADAVFVAIGAILALLICIAGATLYINLHHGNNA